LNKKEKEFYQKEVHSLTQRAAKIREQIQKMYEDRLDGNITYEFWQEQHNNKQNQLDTILRLLHSNDRGKDLKTVVLYQWYPFKIAPKFRLQTSNNRHLIKYLCVM